MKKLLTIFSALILGFNSLYVTNCTPQIEYKDIDSNNYYDQGSKPANELNNVLNLFRVTNNNRQRRANDDKKLDQSPAKKRKEENKGVNNLLVSLNSIILNINLGTLSDDTQDTILTAVQSLNPELNVREIETTKMSYNKDGSQSCTIKVKPSSFLYFGSRTVRFRLAGLPSLSDAYLSHLLSIPLSNVIEKFDLGELSDDSQDTVLRAVHCLNPRLDISQVRVGSTIFNQNGSQSWVIVALTNSLLYSGTKTIRFRVNGIPSSSNSYLSYLLAVPLADVIEEPDLGELPDDSQATILRALKTCNPNLNTNEIKMYLNSKHWDGTQRWRIRAKVNSLCYSGSVNVFFLVIRLDSSLNQICITPLYNVITNNDLGELPDDSQETILTALKTCNSNLNLREVNFNKIVSFPDGSYSCIINSIKNSLFYSGIRTVYFRVPAEASSSQQNVNQVLKVPLRDVITKTDLGELPDDSQETILTVLKTYNPNLNINEIDMALIIKKSDGSQWWKIKVKNNSLCYSGIRTIQLRVVPSVLAQQDEQDSSLPLLSSVILKTNIGLLRANNRMTILRALKHLNSELDITQLRTLFVRTTKDGSQLWRIVSNTENPMYSGSVIVRIRLINSLTLPASQPQPSLNRVSLSDIIIQHNLGVLPNNDVETIRQWLHSLYPRSMNTNHIALNFIGNDPNGIVRWQIVPTEDSNYTNSVEVYFTINPNVIVNFLQGPEVILPDNLENYKYDFIDEENSRQNDQNLDLRQKNNKIVKKYNTISIAEKQAKLKEIHQHFTNLSADEKKEFKKTLQKIGTKALNDGISISGAKITLNEKKPEVIASTIISGGGLLGVSKMTGVSPIQSLKAVGNALKNSLSASRSSATVTEAVELTPLLSTSTTEGLTVAETLTTAETVTEGAVLEAEAATSATLAPETLGLSLLIGGLVLIGTGLLYWIFGPSGTPAAKHESHNQYNEVEKYYKFLAHNQLKLSIDSSKWKTISQIYQEYSNNYQAFLNKIKTEIMSFHKEDHSGWGGTITNSDFDILIKVLFDHFDKINTHFMMNSNHGWKIITNTVGSYFIIEEE